MRRHKMVALSLLLCCALGIWVTWSAANSNARAHMQSETRGGPQASNPLVRVNEKARAAKSGDEAAVRALTDEIFTTFSFDQGPAGMDDAIKERLVRAEVNYRRGGGRGSSEFRIVHMVNLLARKLGAPAYAHTNVFEVRRLRSALLPFTPDLQTWSRGEEMNKGKKRDTSSNIAMSPLEATFFAVSLVQQKRYNVEHQLTNDEWIALHGGKRGKRAGEKFREDMKSRYNDSGRTDEVERAIERGFSVMSPGQILRLPEELLNALGVER